MSKIADNSCVEFNYKKFEAELLTSSKFDFANQIEANTQLLINQINEYKVKFENRIVSGQDIANNLKCCRKFVFQHIQNNEWKCTPSIKYKTSKAHIQQGKLIYTIEGLPIIFTGIVNGKPSKKDTLYTKNTYRYAEIQNIEESCGIKSKAFKSNV